MLLLTHTKYDYHTLRASEIFGVWPSKVTPEQRRYAKSWMFAQNYSFRAPLRTL